MNLSKKVEDQFYDIDEFDKLLLAAEDFAISDWEMDFVADIQEKYKKYGARMFLSDAQVDQLAKIADGK